MTLASLSHLVATDIEWRDTLDTPAVVIDLDIVERNLRRGADFAASAGVDFRPHIKTHKIPALAFAQLELGAKGITAQKVSEAEIMADAGVTDIFLSYNIVGATKLHRLAELHKRTTLRTVADSSEVVEGLASVFRNPERKLGVLVEIDGYLNRCGAISVPHAMQVVQKIREADGLRFDGFMIYPAPGRWKDALSFLSDCTRAAEQLGITVEILSSGGTPDMSSVAPDGGLTEYRAGSYIYNDRSLFERGEVTLDDCALSLLTTVVSAPEPGRAVVDAGSKSLSSDLFGLDGFGLIKGYPEIAITALSEEHGHLSLQGGNPLLVGQRLEVVPNHCCVVSNLVDEVTFVRGAYLVGQQRVTARGTIL